MAVLFITHKFPPSIGGMQKQSYELINGMSKKCKTYLIAHGPFESKLLFFLKLRSRVKKMLRNHPDINVIHCNDGVMAAFVSLFAYFPGLKYSVTFHGLDLVHPSRIYQKYILPRMQNFNAVFCVSQYTANQCMERGFLSDKIHVIPNGVDFTLADQTRQHNFLQQLEDKYSVSLTGKRILLSVGRAVKRKGFSWFAKNVLPQLDNDTVYVVAGPIAQPNSLYARILKVLPNNISKSLNLFLGYPTDSKAIHDLKIMVDSRVIQLSGLAFEEIIQLYHHAELMLMPNIPVEGDMEGFGLVALEANLCGCPVIASRLEGITSAVIDGKNGWLMTPCNSKEWVDSIKKALDNDDLRNELSQSAKQYVLNNFSWNRMTDQYYKHCSILQMDKEIGFSNSIHLQHVG